jgi:hypothetical protein
MLLSAPENGSSRNHHDRSHRFPLAQFNAREFDWHELKQQLATMV